MKHHPAWTALCIWFRGHLIFFIACLFVAGPLAPFTSLIAFFISLPALLLYVLLCILAGNAKLFAWRFGIVLGVAALITHFSYIIGADAADMGAEKDSPWLHAFAIGSTILSVISAGYMLQDTKDKVAAS